MKHSYYYEYDCTPNHPFNIANINNLANFYRPGEVLVEMENTRGITSSMLRRLASNVDIRIAGGYDKKKLQDYAGNVYQGKNNRETNEELMYESVIYTRNEAIQILEQLEKLDKGIRSAWTPIQKIIYTYEYLKKNVMYDPKHEFKHSDSIRSLRGLVTKHTVCAGYALMFKEVMDRHSIPCEFVIGPGHAWNIVTVDGKKYPIDLTWDNDEYRDGKVNSVEWLTKTPAQFASTHKPFPEEVTQDYIHTLSGFNPRLIQRIKNLMGIDRQATYRNQTFTATRNDDKHSKFLISTIDRQIIDGVPYYQYFYMDILPDGHKAYPKILYSEVNISRIVDSKEFGGKVSKEEESAILNGLLSKRNIEDSDRRGTQYIGNVRLGYKNGKIQYIHRISEIPKPPKITSLFKFPINNFVRSDGSVITVQKIGEYKYNNITLNEYDLFEIIGNNGHDYIKRNTVYTEEDLIHDMRREIPNILLARDRLDRKETEAGGYIGYYDSRSGNKVYNSAIRKAFDTNIPMYMATTPQLSGGYTK